MNLLADTGISGELIMAPGSVEVSTGSSSSDIRSTATVDVTGEARTIEGGERAFLAEVTIG